jgi:YD repeat-containing protein
MAFSIYQASIPVFIHGLRNLSSFLGKAHADAQTRKIDFSVLANARLAPDMFPLSRQIQIASDMVKNGAGRLAGIELPSFPDTETTYDELQARIEKTIAFLGTIKESQLEGAESRDILLKFPGREISFSGADYLSLFVLPNFYFHLTAAYAILRHNGVQIGKMDFMGA